MFTKFLKQCLQRQSAVKYQQKLWGMGGTTGTKINLPALLYHKNNNSTTIKQLVISQWRKVKRRVGPYLG
jgi:hypothetical protein